MVLGLQYRTKPYGDRPLRAQEDRRPGVLEELVPSVGLERVVCPCSKAPSLALPSLAAPASDALDDSALHILTAAALRKRKDEEEEKEEEARRQKLKDEVRVEKLEEEFQVLMATERLSSQQDARLNAVMRERGEVRRRMRKTAASSSHPGMGTRRKRKKEGGKGLGAWHPPLHDGCHLADPVWCVGFV